MISAKLYLPDGREIVVKIRERQYKKLTAKLENLSFWEKLRLLFRKRETQ